MSGQNDYEQQARNYAIKAIEYDQNGQHELAITYYLVSLLEE